jgi:hypothetical protein
MNYKKRTQQYNKVIYAAGRSLVREIDDLYNHYVMPVFREWVLHQGDLTSSLLSSKSAPASSVSVDGVSWRPEHVESTSQPDVEKLICLCTSLKVPSYWEIPILADKELCLRMLLGDFRKPRSPTARYGAAIGASVRRLPSKANKHLLTIKIWRYPELGWDPKIMSMSQGKLKAAISHELEHYLDPSYLNALYIQPPKSLSKATLTDHFSYLNQQTEIASRAREVIELAKHYHHSIKDELDHCIEGVRRAVLLNPETSREESKIQLMRYRELLASELLRRLPKLQGKL